MRRILLIYPPSLLMNREDRCQVPTKDVAIAPPLPPTDLMYLAAVAEQTGLECRIIDYTLDDIPMERFIKDLIDYHPDYLVISTTTPTIKLDLRACVEAKKALPSIITIAKGAHFLRFNIDILEAAPDLDIIIRGEPEETLRDFLAGTIPIGEIHGLTWRSPSGIINNPDRRYIDDLDSLPFPARHLVDNTRYVRPDNGKVQAVIKVARGCPFNCFFCLATPVSGAKVRRRSPENIIQEIRLCIERGIRNFLFWSDIFNMDRDWVVRLCEMIMASGLNFTWATNTRVDTIDLEMARLMKRAGCTLVSIGVESGNQEILNKLGKKSNLKKIRESFRIIRKAGLQSFAYYIIGLPWDTRETVEETIRLSIELGSDYANFFTATAFPGTRFFDYALASHLFTAGEQTLAEQYSDAYYLPTVKGHYLSKEEIVALHDMAVRRFFFRPTYMIKTALKISSFRELTLYTKSALRLLCHLSRRKNISSTCVSITL